MTGERVNLQTHTRKQTGRGSEGRKKGQVDYSKQSRRAAGDGCPTASHNSGGSDGGNGSPPKLILFAVGLISNEICSLT